MRRLFRARRLEQNFTISTALLVAVLIGTTMVVVHSRLASTAHRELELRGRSIARSIGAVATPSLLGYNYAALQVAAEGASTDTDVAYVVIHDKEGECAGVAGRVLAPKVSPMPLPPRNPEPASFDLMIDDRNGGFQRVLEVAVPVHVEGVREPWGTVRVGLSTVQSAADLRRIDIGLGLLGAALALAAAAIARWLARRITAPLRRLSEGTQALAAGDMGHRIPVTGAKELADLAVAFNLMMDRVQEKVTESSELQIQLEALNATLEKQVRNRTKALAESETQYRTLVEHSPDAILIIQEGRVRFVNRAFGLTFGVPDEIALCSAFDIASVFEPASAGALRERLERWERGDAAGSIALRGRDTLGRVRHLEVRGSRIEYLGHSAVECLLIDTTEANELRDRLSETEKLRSLGELAGGVAHDFNNLLGAILARSQLLRLREWEPEVDANLAVIEKAAQDGRETVRRIQEFSRVRRDRQFTNLDLSQIVLDALEITRSRWQAEAGSGGAARSVDVRAGDPCPVLGNASELREVFTNLILNAVDAMPGGGELFVSCRRAGTRIIAEVKDAGTGMTETVRRQLFDPFFSTKGSGGMGLGLSVVYGIVTRHGGNIDVVTEPGKGTTFVLGFDAAEDSMETRAATSDGPTAAAEELRADGETATLPGARILVIDDEAEIANVLRDVLTLAGHEITVALGGLEGVRIACSEPFEMVITDLGMPDMSGWDVVARIRESKPHLPVVLLTGWAASLDEAEVRGLSIAALLHKPFEIHELIRTTREVLDGAASVIQEAQHPTGG